MIYAMIAWFGWYPLLVAARWGVLSSISASSYKWKGNQKAWFIGWLVGLAVLAWWSGLGIWGHLMGVGFCISGMSPDHKSDPNSVEDGFHTGGTIVAIAAGFVGLFVVCGLWWPAAAFIGGAAVLYWIRTNWIWWVEVWAASTLFGGLVMGA